MEVNSRIKITKDAYPSVYRGKKGTVISISSIFPEDITIELENGSIIIMEDRYLEVI